MAGKGASSTTAGMSTVATVHRQARTSPPRTPSHAWRSCCHCTAHVPQLYISLSPPPAGPGAAQSSPPDRSAPPPRACRSWTRRWRAPAHKREGGDVQCGGGAGDTRWRGCTQQHVTRGSGRGGWRGTGSTGPSEPTMGKVASRMAVRPCYHPARPAETAVRTSISGFDPPTHPQAIVCVPFSGGKAVPSPSRTPATSCRAWACHCSLPGPRNTWGQGQRRDTNGVGMGGRECGGQLPYRDNWAGTEAKQCFGPLVQPPTSLAAPFP